MYPWTGRNKTKYPIPSLPILIVFVVLGSLWIYKRYHSEDGFNILSFIMTLALVVILFTFGYNVKAYFYNLSGAKFYKAVLIYLLGAAVFAVISAILALFIVGAF